MAYCLTAIATSAKSNTDTDAQAQATVVVATSASKAALVDRIGNRGSDKGEQGKYVELHVNE
ncbi:hypothetical protein GGI03_001258 [Coemansia sp. RSA 2337]|nr:hypothetical protein GGI03_001258 [Coemansia sp. RSA 2337]